MITRRENWPALLNDYVAERVTRPFDWRDNNCALFAADWVALMTGVDLAVEYRERITGPLAACRMMRQGGGIPAIVDRVTSRWGWTPTVPALLRRGDVCLSATPHGPAVGIMLGSIAAFAGPIGITFRPIPAIFRGWRIA